MNKRLISLLLVVMMICTLLPISVLAEDTAGEPSKNVEWMDQVTGKFTNALTSLFDDSLELEDLDEKNIDFETGKGIVAVPVYSKELTDLITSGGIITQSAEAIKVKLSGKNVVPEVKMTITGIEEKTKAIKDLQLTRVNNSVLNSIEPDVDASFDFDEYIDKFVSFTQKALAGFTVISQLAARIPGSNIDIPTAEELTELANATRIDVYKLIGTGKTPAKWEKIVGKIDNFIGFVNDHSLVVKELESFKQVVELFNNTFKGSGLGLSEEECSGDTEFINALTDHYGEPAVEAFIKQALKTVARANLSKYAGSAYHMYVTGQIPEGQYKVHVEAIQRQGFIGETSLDFIVAVNEKKIVYAGDTHRISTDPNDSDIDLSTLIFGKNNDLPTINAQGNTFLESLNKMIETGNSVKESASIIIAKMQELVNMHEFTIGELEVKLPLTVKYALIFTGLFLDREDPYIGFTNQNLAGKNIAIENEKERAEFVMVDRDELLNVMEAMIGVGKDTFTNVVNSVKAIYQNTDPEAELPTWEEFVKMHQDVLLDTSGETPQIDFEAKNLIPLVWIYVKMMDIPQVWDSFLGKDVRLPAILSTSADENGFVRIDESKNVTLVWMIDALLNIADVSQDAIQAVAAELTSDDNESIESIINAAFEGANLDNPELRTLLVNVLAWLVENTAEGTQTIVQLLNAFIDPVKGVINEWIYPLLQNDQLFQMVGGFLETGDNKMHAILTDKMPDSYYLLLQKQAPEGYMINPMVYTVKLDWSEDGWVYAKIANLGIVLPYFAENYYTFVRNNSMVKTGDKVLNTVFGDDADVLRRALNAGDDHLDLTSAAIELFGKMIYQNMGGSEEYSSEEALNNDLINYMAGHGRNVQSLMMFANQVALRSKAVVTADLNEEWYFYNFDDSLHTSYTNKITALLEGVSNSITSKTIVGEATKAIIAAQVSTIGKIDNAITQATQKYTEAVKETVSKAAKSVAESATKTIISTATKVVSSLISKLFKR